MAGSGWTFADLDKSHLELVRLAERTLPADVVMVYEEGGTGLAPDPARAVADLQPVPLAPDELECLQGLERQVEGIAVAYRRAAG